MAEEMNKENESKKSEVSKCPYKEGCLPAYGKKVIEEIFERIDESLKDVRVPPNEWKIYYRIERILVLFPHKQPQHVNEEEAKLISKLREHHKYSIGDLAFIFMRSKSAIHEVLNR